LGYILGAFVINSSGHHGSSPDSAIASVGGYAESEQFEENQLGAKLL
jgi:hypothetical protein